MLVMTPGEAAKALRMRPAEVYRLLESGDIPAYRDKSAWKIPVRALERYVEERAEEESRERRIIYESYNESDKEGSICEETCS